MTAELDTQQRCLEKVNQIESDACWYQQSDGQCDDIHHIMNALRSAIERHGADKRWLPYEGYEGGSFDTAEEAWDNQEEFNGELDESRLGYFLICKSCGEINTSAMEDADEWVYLPEVYFPCPELRDIEGKLFG